MQITSSPATVLIVDDHPIYLDGIKNMLQSLLGDVTVLQAGTGKAAIELVSERIDIDWIFLDYHLPDLTGNQLLQAFNDLLVSAPVVLMSGSDDLALVTQALELGASGFIPKAFGKATFQACLATVQSGAIFLPDDLKVQVEQYRNTVLKVKSAIVNQLSGRRLEILVLMSEGYTNGEMATTLSIAEATVKSHVSALLTIFDVDNRSHCVAEARKLGLLK